MLDEYGGEALILYFSGGHYRQPIAFSDERMQEAVRSVERIREAARKLVKGEPAPALRAHRDAFFDALANDFNSPDALAALFNWVREANRSEEAVGDADLVEMLSVLGLESIVTAGEDDDAPEEAWALVDQRQAARKARDFAEADRLRDELRALGWEVRDGPDGPELVRI